MMVAEDGGGQRWLDPRANLVPLGNAAAWSAGEERSGASAWGTDTALPRPNNKSIKGENRWVLEREGERQWTRIPTVSNNHDANEQLGSGGRHDQTTKDKRRVLS